MTTTTKATGARRTDPALDEPRGEAFDAIQAVRDGLSDLADWLLEHDHVTIAAAGPKSPLLFWLGRGGGGDNLLLAAKLLAGDGDAISMTRATHGNLLRVSRHFGGGVELAAFGVLDELGTPATRMEEVISWELPDALDVIPEVN